MMVSSAMAVLPVWRSPMINSRWPRPMGIMASMALMPVCSGSLTGRRSTTPGASRSMGLNCVLWMGPLSSMGLPRALTTRPTMASPTGTDMMRPVRRTSSPSLISVASPNSTAPTWSSARFMAIPRGAHAHFLSGKPFKLVRHGIAVPLIQLLGRADFGAGEAQALVRQQIERFQNFREHRDTAMIREHEQKITRHARDAQFRADAPQHGALAGGRHGRRHESVTQLRRSGEHFLETAQLAQQLVRVHP